MGKVNQINTHTLRTGFEKGKQFISVTSAGIINHPSSNKRFALITESANPPIFPTARRATNLFNKVN
jgi:hypothetical protein